MGEEKNLSGMTNFNEQADRKTPLTESEKAIHKAALKGEADKKNKDNPYIDAKNTDEERLRDMDNDGGGQGRNNGSDMSGR